MSTTALWAAVLGIVLLIAAASIPPYKDSSAMADARFAYPADISSSKEASARYFAVRDQQLTSKFLLQDYGWTLLELVAVLCVVRSAYSATRFKDLLLIRNPARRWQVVVVGLAAAISNTIAYVFSLILGGMRDEYPPWADSLGIPLAGVPFIFAVQCTVVGAFAILGGINYLGGHPIRDAFKSPSRPRAMWQVFLGIPFLLVALFLIADVATGGFVFIVPMLLWTVFFLHWFAGKQRPANPRVESDALARLTRTR